MRRLFVAVAMLVLGGCNCISLRGATCTSDTECGAELTCVNDCCGGCDADGGVNTSPIAFVNAAGDFSPSAMATFNLPRPGNADAGDLLVAIVTYTPVATVLPPPGFVKVRDRDTGCAGYHVALYTYVVPPQDLPAYTFSTSTDGGAATARWVGAVAAYRGVRLSAPVLTSQLMGVSQSTANPPSFPVPSVNVAGDGALAVVLFHLTTTTMVMLTPPPQLSERYDTGFSGIFDAPSPPGTFASGQIEATDNGSCQANIGVVVLQP